MRKIFGHRGLPHIYEENTFKSLNKAQKTCDFVETDVRITKDEELVLYHDAEIQNQKIEELVSNHFDLRPGAIIRDLNLRSPIYKQTAAYGHFGRADLSLPWENTDRAAKIRSDAGL